MKKRELGNIFLELSNASAEEFVLKQKLSTIRDAKITLKLELVQSFIDECLTSSEHMHLLYEYATSKNFGMDVDMYESDNLYYYAKKYIKDIYRYNVDMIDYDMIDFSKLH